MQRSTKKLHAGEREQDLIWCPTIPGAKRGTWGTHFQEAGSHPASGNNKTSPKSRLRSIPSLVVLALPLGVRTLEIFDLVLVKVPQAGSHFIDQIVIVRDQQHCAFIAL